jgi:hypothetical protein
MDLKTPKKAQPFTKIIAINECSSPPKEKKTKNSAALIDVSCPICQETVSKPTPDGIVESWSLLPCGHKFGSHCIKHWLGLVAEKPCCPVCRKDAFFSCGHPVLPVVMSKDEARKGDGCRGEDWSEKLQNLVCDYCNPPCRWPNAVVKVPQRMGFKGLARGCWRLLRTGRVRQSQQDRTRVEVGADLEASRWQREENIRAMWIAHTALSTGLRDPGWEEWWNNQEPRNVQ